MFNKLIPLALGALLVVACGEDASIPTDDTSAAIVGSDDQSFPRRGQLLERLEAEGDAETRALVEQAQEARTAAKDAFQAGDREIAHAHAREAKGYLHQAIERTFPELAARIEQRRAERGDRGARSGGHWSDGEGRRREAMSRLRAEADDETVALLDQAAAVREAAREAFRAGNEEEAKLKMQEAHEAMRQAITRIDPELAAKMESHRQQRMERHGMKRQP
jgi:hypothetical protein